MKNCPFAGVLTVATALMLSLPAHADSKAAKSKAPPKQDGPATTAENTMYPGTEMLGIKWLPDKGVVVGAGAFRPEGADEYAFEDKDGKYDTRRALPYKLDGKTCITLRLINDFKSTDEKATPANFAWVKDAGSSGEWNVDAALRADFWIPGLYDAEGAEMSLALGYEIHRDDSGGGTKDLQSFHLALPFVDKWLFGNIPFLKTSDQVWQVDVSYNMDGISNDDGFDVETDYKPSFKLPLGKYGLWFGPRCAMKGEEAGDPLDPGQRIEVPYYSFVPKAGVSYGSRYSLGSPIANLDSEVVGSYEFIATAGRPIGVHKDYIVELELGVKGGQVLSGGASFDQQHATLRFKRQSGNPFTLDLSYTNGANAFGDPELDRFEAKLGVQF